MIAYSAVYRAFREMKDANPDIPEDCWTRMESNLSDSRLYYDGGQDTPTYEIAHEYLEAAVQGYRERQ